MENKKKVSIETSLDQNPLISFGFILIISVLMIVFLTSCNTSVDSSGELNIEIIDNSDDNLTEIFDLIILRYYEAKKQIERLDHKIPENEKITDYFFKLNGFNDIDEYYTDLEIFSAKVKDLGIKQHVKKKEESYHLSDSLLNLIENYKAGNNKNFNQKTNTFSGGDSDCNYSYGDCMESVIITYFLAVGTGASTGCYSCLFYAEAGLWVGILSCERAYNRCVERAE